MALAVFLAYILFLLVSLLPTLLSSLLFLWFSFFRRIVFSFYDSLERRNKMHFLFPFVFTFYYIFVYAYEHRRLFYDFLVFLSLFSTLWSTFWPIIFLRYLFLFGFHFPAHPFFYFVLGLCGFFLSLPRLWISLSLAFYRTSTSWNFTRMDSLFDQYLLLSQERPLIKTLFNLSFNPSFHHLPPPPGPKLSVDGWTRSQIIGGMIIGGLGLFVSGGLLYYAHEQHLTSQANLLATQELVRQKTRKNDLKEKELLWLEKNPRE